MVLAFSVQLPASLGPQLCCGHCPTATALVLLWSYDDKHVGGVARVTARGQPVARGPRPPALLAACSLRLAACGLRPRPLQKKTLSVVFAWMQCPSAKKYDLLPLFWPRSGAPSAKNYDLLPLFWPRSGAPSAKKYDLLPLF